MKTIYSLLIGFAVLISCSAPKNNEVQNKSDIAPVSKIFEGDFIYFADSAVFTDYATASNFQVSDKGEYLNLERKFISFNFEDPTKVYLKVEGYLEERPGMEKNTMDTYLVVTKLIGFDTNRTTSLF